MMWLTLLAGIALGFPFGFGYGMQVRAELAMRATQAVRRGMRWVAVRSRRAQERRARHIAAHADEWNETRKERGDECA